jgi:hypothetical protein
MTAGRKSKCNLQSAEWLLLGSPQSQLSHHEKVDSNPWVDTMALKEGGGITEAEKNDDTEVTQGRNVPARMKQD